MKRVAAVLLSCWLAATMAARPAQAGDYIAEDEVQTYLVMLGQAMGRCDAAWMGKQFTPSAKIRYVYADRSRQTFTPAQYAEDFRRHCNPLEFEKRQVINSRISDEYGGDKRVGWTFWWGRRAGATVSGPSTATLMLDNEALLTKDGETIRITQATWRIRELVPGAQEAYLREVPGPIDAARKTFEGGTTQMNQWNEQFMTWFNGLFKKKPAPRQDNGWN